MKGLRDEKTRVLAELDALKQSDMATRDSTTIGTCGARGRNAVAGRSVGEVAGTSDCRKEQTTAGVDGNKKEQTAGEMGRKERVAAAGRKEGAIWSYSETSGKFVATYSIHI